MGSTTTIASDGRLLCAGDMVAAAPAAEGAPGGMTVAAAATAAMAVAVLLPLQLLYVRLFRTLFAVAGGDGGSCDGGSLLGGGGAGGNTSSSMVQTRSSMGNLKLISFVGVVGVLACSGGLLAFTPFPLLVSKPFSIHLPLSPKKRVDERKYH